MASLWKVNIEFLEQGNIYFFYKPKKGITEVNGLDEVGRFYFVLDPYGSKEMRFVIMGPKRMPSIHDGREQAWGFVEKVGGRGYRVLNPQKAVSSSQRGARPAGEGLYAVVRHFDHTHLVYVLELPARLGEVQKTLNIERQANYVFIVQRPNLTPPIDLEGRPQQKYDNALLERFGGRKYIPVDPPSLLDSEGATLYVIGVNDELSKLGVSVDRDRETAETADIFTQLKVSKNRHPTEPLLKGTWK